MKFLSRLAIAGGALLLPVLLASVADPLASGGNAQKKKQPSKYVSAKLCKNCHNRKDNGHPYDTWAGTPHASAYKILASDKAKEFGKKVGIANPQKSGKCLECHVTAYGIAKKLAKKIKPKDGVQCETCHGPGDVHVKRRMMAAAKSGFDPAERQKLTEGEIITKPTASTCLKCHNDKSPGYKPFCFKEFMAKIRHLDPRKKRSKADMKQLVEACYSKCPKCSKKNGEAKEAAKKK